MATCSSCNKVFCIAYKPKPYPLKLSSGLHVYHQHNLGRQATRNDQRHPIQPEQPSKRLNQKVPAGNGFRMAETFQEHLFLKTGLLPASYHR